MTAAETYDPTPLAHAMGLLQACCDGAHSRDASGFSAYDKDFGYALADTPPDRWTPKMTAGAHRLAVKYRKQLAGLGVDATAIPTPPSVATATGRTVVWHGAEIHVLFAYDPALVDAIRRVPGARFERSTPPKWTIPATDAGKAALKHFALEHGFTIDAEAERALATVAAAAPVPARVCDVHPDEAECLALTFPYDPSIVQDIRALAAWQAQAKRWRVPLFSAERTAPLVAALAKWGFVVTPAAQARMDSVLALRAATYAASKAVDGTIEVPGLTATLRGFQASGVRYALERKRTFIADEPGLGKTIQAIATALAADAFPMAVVCPATLKENWRREFKKFAPGVTVEVISGTRRRMTLADVVIVNYDIVDAHLPELARRELEMLVLDESHLVKSGKAKRTKACRTAAKGVGRVLLLTGTPVLNKPEELIAQLAIMDRLTDVGGYGYFKRRFCDGTRADLVALHDLLRTTCYVRRLKKDVLAELPAKQRSTVVVSIDNRAEYARAEAELIAWLRDHVEQDRTFLETIAHLDAEAQAVAIEARKDYKQRAAERAEQLVRIESLKQVAARGKLAGVQAWLDTFQESGEKIVLFGTHTEVIRAVADRRQAPTITGADDQEARQRAVDRFQADPLCKAIVLNMQAGGVGLTLTAASNVGFLELGWTPGAHDQAEDRCHRIGQRDSVMAWYFLAEDTIEEDIADLLDKKRDVVNATTDGTPADAEVGVFAAVLGRLMTRKNKSTGPDYLLDSE